LQKMARRLPSQRHDWSTPSADIPRSVFDRSHPYKTTFNAGFLVPILVDEMVPGDTFNVRLQGFARMATPIFPIMDNLHMETFFFAVSHRLVHDNWAKLMGEQLNPGDSIDYLAPQVAGPSVSTGYDPETVADYMGIPTGIASVAHSAYWLRAYNLIIREWFRNQNLQNSPEVRTDDGPDSYSLYTLRRRNKRPDYFVAANPWPQKGPEVQLPLGSEAPVRGIGVQQDATWAGPSAADIRETGGFTTTYTQFQNPQASPSVRIQGSSDFPYVYADLANATAANVNEWRTALAVQKILERDARVGTRLVEIIEGHFRVHSPDQRMQRPEYLGGGSSPINVTAVPQTSASQTTPASPQGNLAAFATANLNGHGFTYSAVEHVVILGLVNVRADITYQQGLHRMWSRRTRYDFYMPSLAHLGEQAILNKEIYYGTDNAENNKAFGYIPVWDEYRYKPGMITGKFRSNTPGGSLDPWHLSEFFPAPPKLDETFISSNPPIDRVVAVQDEPHFIFDGWFNMRCARPMPTHGIPGLWPRF
jgi:hypothetical protein